MWSSGLKMDKACFSETFVSTHKSTGCDYPEDRHLHSGFWYSSFTHLCLRNVRSFILIFLKSAVFVAGPLNLSYFELT
jgi:hypothetical protein